MQLVREKKKYMISDFAYLPKKITSRGIKKKISVKTTIRYVIGWIYNHVVLSKY